MMFFRSVARTFVLVLMVAAATLLLMRFAPGYFSDAREMDAPYAESARAHLQAEQRDGSLRAIAVSTLGAWRHGSLGISRQYDVPVLTLIRPRLAVTAPLLLRGVLCGWFLALCSALCAAHPSPAGRTGVRLVGAPFTVLLAVPTGAMATVCLLSGQGGPALVLTLVLAARDFKFLHRVLRAAWNAPHVLHARAQGLRGPQLVRVHVLPNVLPQMLALATLSLVTALSALVPVEVLFDVPGLGQLAWTAALNRDLPVLLAVTMLMACAVAFAGVLSQGVRSARPRMETA